MDSILLDNARPNECFIKLKGGIYYDFTKSIQFTPNEYENVCKNLRDLSNDKDLVSVKEELCKRYHLTKGSFDEWFSAIYYKIDSYKCLSNKDARSPCLAPNGFSGIRFKYDFESIPVIQKIKQLEQGV